MTLIELPISLPLASSSLTRMSKRYVAYLISNRITTVLLQAPLAEITADTDTDSRSIHHASNQPPIQDPTPAEPPHHPPHAPPSSSASGLAQVPWNATTDPPTPPPANPSLPLSRSHISSGGSSAGHAVDISTYVRVRNGAWKREGGIGGSFEPGVG